MGATGKVSHNDCIESGAALAEFLNKDYPPKDPHFYYDYIETMGLTVRRRPAGGIARILIPDDRKNDLIQYNKLQAATDLLKFIQKGM